MDCHGRKLRALGLALMLLSGVGGCLHPSTTSTTTARVTTIPPDAVIEKEKPSPVHPPQPASCVAAGNFYAQEANNKDRGTNQQEQLRETARKAYQQALALDPKYVAAYHALAQLYTSMDDHDHAITTYQYGIRQVPRDSSLHYQLGWCYARKKDWGSAIPSFKNAVDIDPENRPYVNTLGFALARAGQYEQSLQCFARVQSEPMARFQLARMLLHLQQPAMCRQQLQIALSQDPKLDVARKMLAQLDGAPANGVQTVGYIEPQSAPVAQAEPSPQSQPTAVEVKPEVTETRRLLPPPPRMSSSATSMMILDATPTE
jgi:tetratricopeptide (TPR) repeat protein